MNDFIEQLLTELQQVCRDKTDCKSVILGSEKTKKFFDCRKQWDKRIRVHCEQGELVELDLPSFPLPVMTNTTERYFYEGIEIIPAYQYHSIVYFFLRRLHVDLNSFGVPPYYALDKARREKKSKSITEEEE
ncbi:hypothetical protein DEEACLCL_00124 [Salmonella phage CRW-SP2]|nr:hypothetical protein DEEACLCL_00124 [Salmonella phage CRW-SP2]